MTPFREALVATLLLSLTRNPRCHEGLAGRWRQDLHSSRGEGSVMTRSRFCELANEPSFSISGLAKEPRFFLFNFVSDSILSNVIAAIDVEVSTH